MRDLRRNIMEQMMGVEPTTRLWKSRILAVILHLQIGGLDRN